MPYIITYNYYHHWYDDNMNTHCSLPAWQPSDNQPPLPYSSPDHCLTKLWPLHAYLLFSWMDIHRTGQVLTWGICYNRTPIRSPLPHSVQSHTQWPGLLRQITINPLAMALGMQSMSSPHNWLHPGSVVRWGVHQWLGEAQQAGHWSLVWVTSSTGLVWATCPLLND